MADLLPAMPAPPSGAGLQAFLGGRAPVQPVTPPGPGAFPAQPVAPAPGSQAFLGGRTAAAALPTLPPVLPASQSVPAAPANPYAPGGVIPPVATPEAIAAFRASIGGSPRQAPAAPVDPLSNQIRFIDQNSPKVAAPTPSVVGGGSTIHSGSVGGFEGGGGRMNLPQFQAISPFLQEQQKASLNPETHAKTQLAQIYADRRDKAIAAAGNDPAKQEQAILDYEQNLRYLLYGPVIGGVAVKQPGT